MDGVTASANGSQQQRGRQSQSQSQPQSQSHYQLGRSSPPPSAGPRPSAAVAKRQWVEVSGLEYGVVASVKDGKYAFIHCAEREGPELFFHLSDLTEPSSGIQRGDEVSFVVCCDAVPDSQQPPQSQRYFAKRVSRLQPGTVSFERVDERGVRGVIEAELKKPNRGARGVEGYGGRIRRSAAANGTNSGSERERESSHGAAADGFSSSSSSGADESQPSLALSLEFAERDLLDWPCLPAVGDIASFDVFTEKRSNRQGATAVRLIALNPASRQRGIVSVMKEGYGFIRPEDAPAGNRELFFHFSALLDSNYQPAVGDEIQFDTQRDEQQGRLSAQRITLLPKGSIKRDLVGPERFVGVVDREFVADALPAAGNEQTSNSPSPQPSSVIRRSAIRYYPSSPSSLPASPASADSALLEFSSSDCRDARPILVKGDTVTFQLLTRAKTGTQRPVNVTLLQASSADREQGKVVSVNSQGGFAFIRRALREGELFMHASNYKQQQSDSSADSAAPSSASSSSGGGAGTPFVAEGAEVEYSLWLADNGRLCAVRGVPLPPGTVSFERLLHGVYRGVVSREPRRRERSRTAAFERQRSGGDQAATQDERGEIRITHCVDSLSNEPSPLPSGTSPFVVSFSASSCPQPLLVGDTVDCRVAVHNWNGLHAARDVTVHQLRASPAQECGVVQQLPLPGVNGRQGRISCQLSGALLPFNSHHFLNSAEADQLTVGDSVQFDCVELSAEAVSRRLAAGGGGGGGKDRRVAARLSLLPRGSVQLESVDRSLRFRGRVEDIPSNPKSNKQTAGHIFVLSTHSSSNSGDSQTAEQQPADDSTANSSDSDTVSGAPASSSAVSLSVSSLSLSASPAPLRSPTDSLLGSLVEFRFRDIVGNSFLAKGDPVEFFVLFSTSGTVRAADVSLLPLQATVASLPNQSNPADGGGGSTNSAGKSSKSSFGHLSILPVSTATAAAASAPSPSSFSPASLTWLSLPSPSSSSPTTAALTSAASSSPSVPPSSATFLDESVVFSVSDVIGSVQLSVGDLVSIGGMQFNYDRKRRQARLIALVKAAPKSQQAGQQYAAAASERRLKRGTASAAASGGGEQSSGSGATTTMRFARGPDDTRGFASRRGAGQQGVTVGLQRTTTSSGTSSNAVPAASSGRIDGSDGSAASASGSARWAEGGKLLQSVSAVRRPC